MVRRSLLTSVGCVMGESRCSVAFLDMVVGGRGALPCCQAVGRCSRCDPCTPGWLDVGRPACGPFTVNSWLQLRCGWCVVVLAAPWSAWFARVSLRCCRWSYRRTLFVYPARPCRCWLVVSWCVQVRRSVLCERWLVGRLTVRRRLVMWVGRLRDGRVTVFCFVRGYGRRRVWRTRVSPTRWTPFLLRPVHAWMVWCWPACVWSAYGQVAAAAAVWWVRGCLGRLMVGLVCVGSVALLQVVASSNFRVGAGWFCPGLSKCGVV